MGSSVFGQDGLGLGVYRGRRHCPSSEGASVGPEPRAAVKVKVESLNLSDSLRVYPMICSLPGSSVHRILQARILECFAIPSSRDLPNPGIERTQISHIVGRFFTVLASRKARAATGAFEGECPSEATCSWSAHRVHGSV